MNTTENKAPSQNNIRLSLNKISKCFGSTLALSNISVDFHSGEIHALIGENGAGKSTLMKILSGAIQPDSGTLSLDGVPYSPRSPHEGRLSGVAMIYQELTLAPDLSVEANILLGIEKNSLGFISAEEHRIEVKKALLKLDHPEIDPDTLVRDLSQGAKQLVEIARALFLDSSVLIFDEPTSSLTRQDSLRLFEIMKRLREQRVTILYITHYLEEVREVADRITVLRDGERIVTGALPEFTDAQIVEAMIGRSLQEQFPKVPHQPGEILLEVKDLEGRLLPRGVGFSLRRGEILGIAGIMGAGRTELLRAIFALDPVIKGKIRVKSLSSSHCTPHLRIEQGLGFLSEDRKNEGLALEQSIDDNLTGSRLKPYSTFGILNLKKKKQIACEWLSKLGVKYRDAGQSINDLSGGNQQKVALGRLLHQDADILLLDEPTRGVDVGSKVEIYRLIGELAAQGKAVLVVSSYLPELFGICDRLAVMNRGKLSETRIVNEWQPEQVMTYATGATFL